WIHIDKDEQLRRFEDRQRTPAKQWKITDEDWRNREKWDQYEEAVDDMFKLTSTDFAPWHIIEGNNKLYARIQTLKIINDTIESRLSETKKRRR
ncbi:MAG: phosphate--AMP phosphotransferase, partial [Lachnospiraceae bacterium]|nr:phosphate--AMP phosphotransferase [Lachnospiraceae bacterium]